MGKGDKKTRRGKIYRGSHGNARPHAPVGAGSAGPSVAAVRGPARSPAKAPAKRTVRRTTTRKATT